MDPVSILYVLLGILIIAGRGPLVFAPRASLRFIDRLISSDTRLRAVALFLALLAVPLVVFPGGEGVAAGFLRALGWLFAATTLWLLAAPDSYRRLARGVIGYFERSVDEAIVRIIGLVAVAIGVALIYVGIVVV